MKIHTFIARAALGCLAVVVGIGMAQAQGTNVLYNPSFELPRSPIQPLNSGFDGVPGWYSGAPTSSSGVELDANAADGNWDAYTLDADHCHAKQTSSYIIQGGDCFQVTVASRNTEVFTLNFGPTDGYLSVALYYGGTANTEGTLFYTNTFRIPPSPGWTNCFFGVNSDLVPATAIGQPIGIDIWQSTSEYNPNAAPYQSWLEFDNVRLIPANAPTVSSPTISPTNRVWGGETLTLSASAVGFLPLAYQWQTDGGGGGALTNIPGATLTNLVVVTSTNAGIYNYDVVVTNDFGAATSTVVSITVRGPAAPFVTQDTGTLENGPITNIFAFVGGTVNFSASFDGSPPITNQWLFDSGGGFSPIPGALNVNGDSSWTVTNVQPSSAGDYELAATNAIGRSNSSAAHLTALPDPGAPDPTDLFVYAVYTNHPWAYWRFEETNDTYSSSMQAYDYSGHNFDATYGNNALDGGETLIDEGLYGPTPPDYPGFAATNKAAGLDHFRSVGYLTVPPLNLNTNTVSFVMWIYPYSSIIAPNSGLLMNRNGDDGAGVGFGSSVNGNLMAELGYTWNSNSPGAFGFHSGLYPVPGIWNLCAWVITPTNTTIYLCNNTGSATNLLKAVQDNVTNSPEAFSGGATWLGSDPAGGLGGVRTFDGAIDEVAVFANSLTEPQIQDLFLKSLRIPGYLPPQIDSQPPDKIVFQGTTLRLFCGASGIPKLAYQWQGLNGIQWQNLLNSSMVGITGATNDTLVWSNYTGVINNFRVVVTNYSGAVTSRVAHVTVVPVPSNGLWTVNFAITTAGPGPLYHGRGILGTNLYWNALTGSPVLSGLWFNNTPPSLLDDGATVSGIHFGSASIWMGTTTTFGTNNALLDTYCSFVAAGADFVFTSVPNGTYNLALYGIDGGYADEGTVFRVNGVSLAATNVQNLFIAPDNTVIYRNVVVTNGTLEVTMTPLSIPGRVCPMWGCPGAFNGAQLQLVQYAPPPPNVGITCTNGVCMLTWTNGRILSATNLLGPWMTNNWTSPYTFAPTGQMQFFNLINTNFF